MPTRKTVSDIKANLLQPALTSHFEVRIPIPPGLLSTNKKYLNQNNVNLNQDKLNLLCSEASLPGSSIATHEINNDFHGVTERHAYRRLYDDRIDLTFYVDAINYMPIRYFETWIKYVVGESVRGGNAGEGSDSPNYFYRMHYPKDYIAAQGLEITKFERSFGAPKVTIPLNRPLTYKFVNVFPTAITSMPVSYDTSSLLKCNVSLSYIRYYVAETNDKNNSSTSSLSPSQTQNFNLSPQQLAALNSQAFPSNINLSPVLGQTTSGGVNFNTAGSAGNTINVENRYPVNFTLN